MTRPSQRFSSILRSFAGTVLPLAIVCVLPVLAARPAQTQTFSVLHAFTGGGDGAAPYASVTIGGPGTLYGTTFAGGGSQCQNDPPPPGCGVVFKITQHNRAWVLAPLYAFTGLSDGWGPFAPVVFGPGNLLYGSTIYGGNDGQCFSEGCGLVFTLQAPPTACQTALCRWIENPIYRFASESDGYWPEGNLAFDQAGNVYGSTYAGGAPGCGTVFQLTRSGSSWTKTTLYTFFDECGDEGAGPTGVIIDRFGNLYGVANQGGDWNFGFVFELMPSGSGWTEKTIYNFQFDSAGGYPVGGLVIDAAGNLYGTTTEGGAGGGGTVFELSPSGGGWTLNVIASLSGIFGSEGSLAFDSAGNLYGTTSYDGMQRCGNVFKLTHSGGQWTYSDLYDFTCGNDGAYPYAGPTVDSSGNIYGTTNAGGSFAKGVVWEITP